MIRKLTNNHSISSQNFRRHPDSPWLWIFVSIGSVSLHLLAFWLMRSSDEFKPWFPQSNQSSIPIEFIEISSEPQSKVKPQSTIPTIKPQSSFSPSSQSVPVKPSNENDSEITSSINLPQQGQTQEPEVRKTEVEKPEVKKAEVKKAEVEKPEVRKPEVEKPEVEKPEARKPEVEKPPVRQQSYPTNPIAEATPIIPESELPWNSRQEVKLGEGTLLPQDIPESSPTTNAETFPSPNPESSPTTNAETFPSPNPESSPTTNAETFPSPNPESSPTTNAETFPSPNPESSPTTNGGGAIATVDPILKEEVTELIQQRIVRGNDLPEVLAEYKGVREKELEFSIVSSEKNLKPANILASLIIDDQGNFQEAFVIAIEPAALLKDKGIYEQALNQMFQNERFIAGYNEDGSKPPKSNLYIRLKIKINSQ
jgi:hypothetical protein